MGPAPQGEEWFYLSGEGTQEGPVVVEELRRLYKAGEVNFSTYVWAEGRTDWCEMNDIPALKARLAPKKTSVAPTSAPPPPVQVRKRPTSQNGSPVSPKPKPKPKPDEAKKRNSKSKLEDLKSGAQSRTKRPLSGRAMSHRSKSANWVEKKTVDGVLYYYNASLEKVTYDKPEELKSDAEKKEDSGDWVWTRDAKEAWLPGRVVQRDGTQLTVEVKGRGTKVYSAGSSTRAEEPLWPVALSSLSRLEDDMVLLDELNEAMMVHDVKERYKRDDIYTWVGASQTVLVAVNPFQRLPLYGVQLMQDFAKPAPNRLLPPHPFAVANGAYLRLRVDAKDQAMLISGESGAGKTETTKQVLSFLAEIAGSNTNVEQRILSANPVLEAFGNAKTVRNNNSSRFGRWMEVHFDERGSINSARIENYLLEKSRVVAQAVNERCYHVFYQLINSSSAARLHAGALERDASKHGFLKASKCFKVAGIDDRADFQDVHRSLDQLGLKKPEIDALFSLTAGVLRIGDLTFSAKGDGSDITATKVLTVTAQLLGISDVSKMTSALTHTAIEVRGSRTLSPCAPDAAVAGAAALAKAIFGRLFDWLVQRINKAVAYADNDDDENDENENENEEDRYFDRKNDNISSDKFIGVLDIFGFEIFEKNSFEQLCINYTNEKLQQHFNRHTFKEEAELYTNEGIDFEPIKFIDNQPVLDLIEKKPHGILLLLDDEVTAPKGSDAKWLSRCEAAHAGKPQWLSVAEKHATGTKSSSSSSSSQKHHSTANPRAAASSASSSKEDDFFSVNHYAGNVTYRSADMCLKNKDPLGRNLYDLMALDAKGHSIVETDLFPPLGANPRRGFTIAGQFRKQLTALMKIIDAAEPCYVRCVKPNDLKKPRTFDAHACVEQMTYAGVFEAVKIRKSGYPFRLAHRRFAARYRILVDAVALKSNPDLAPTAPERVRCRAILKHLQAQDFANVKIGVTMILYRAPEHRVLELLRNLALERVVPVAQRGLRRGMGRVYRRILKRVRDNLTATLASPTRNSDAALLDAEIGDALARIGPHQGMFPFMPPEIDKAKKRRFMLQERLDLDVVMERLLAEPDPSYEALSDCVRRADAIAAVPGTPAQMALENRVRDALTAVAGAKIDPLAAAAVDVLDKTLMETVRDEAARARYESDDVAKIDEYLAMSDQDLTKLQLKRANELDDPDRVVNREIKLKQLMLETYAAVYSPSRYAGLREPREWAARKSSFFSSSSKREKLAAKMLKHQSTAIHCALTDPAKHTTGVNGSGESSPAAVSAKSYDKKATQLFKCVLGFLGETKHPYPDSLAAEALGMALADANLRTELYAQLVKQLVENPNDASADKAWQMLAAAFATFPPPPAYENQAALFVKQHAPANKREALTAQLYAGVYGGARKNPVSADELPRLVAQTLNSEISARYLDADLVDASASASASAGTAGPPPRRSAKMPPPPPPKLR